MHKSNIRTVILQPALCVVHIVGEWTLMKANPSSGLAGPNLEVVRSVSLVSSTSSAKTGTL